MILKGNQRAGGRQMALHLLNGDQNEHVTVHEVSGFVADDVLGALNEAYAISKATKCKQFMYSLSLNPPSDKSVPVEIFEETLKRVEKKLGLEDQPRVVVFHEKEGRRHAHCVWSRINTDEMKAINISYDHSKLNALSKSIFLENGWALPKGFKDKNYKNPLNYSRGEWQQAMRTGQNPKTIKAALQESWAISSCKTGFEYALSQRGYYLARGDRRGFVAVDVYGEVYSLTRQLAGVKKKDLEMRLGKAEKLPPVAEVKDKITNKLSDVFQNFLDEQNKGFKKAMKPLLEVKRDMTKQHLIDRAAQKAYQEKRWNEEESKRSARIRRGFKGIWDKINGRYWKFRKRNEQETWKSFQRDRQEREELISTQLNQRQNLQMQLNLLQTKHETERQNLIRDLSHMADIQENKDKNAEPEPQKSQDHQINKGFDNPDIDMEPEI